MAGEHYLRLAAACHCGEPVKLWSGRGRKPTHCESHSRTGAKPRPKSQTKQCPACRGIFVSGGERHRFCSADCARRARRGSKPFDELLQYTCTHCGKDFESKHKGVLYCSKQCKVKAWRAVCPERQAQHGKPKVCAYWAGYCADCGVAIGGGRKRGRCEACTRRAQLESERQRSNARLESLHRAAAKEVKCEECGAEFCPLYGAKIQSLCPPCAMERQQAHKRAQKSRRRARQRGIQSEAVDPIKVFDRDGWRCYLCGIDTPRAKRGGRDDDAPELEQVVPLSRGGAHSYANTRCACRRCNWFKGDWLLSELGLSEGYRGMKSLEPCNS